MYLQRHTEASDNDTNRQVWLGNKGSDWPGNDM